MFEANNECTAFTGCRPSAGIVSKGAKVEKVEKVNYGKLFT